MNNNEAIGAAALTLFALVGLVGLVWGRRSRRSGGPQKVGTIGDIYIYPIKSCKGIRVDSAECTPIGPKHGNIRDRTFMVRSEKRDNFDTAKDYPRMVCVEPSFPKDGYLCLDAPGMDSLWINLEDAERGSVITTTFEGMVMEGYDCGDEVVKWFERFLGKPGLHLVYFGSGLNPTHSNTRNRIGHMMRETDILAYSNRTSYMVMSSASMREINGKLNMTLPITNFRSNFVVDGTKAYDEDKWSALQIGPEVQLKVLKLCERCPQININAETGIRHQSEPLKTLRKTHPSCDENLNKILGGTPAVMGLNVGIDVTGTIRTGDPVYVTYK